MAGADERDEIIHTVALNPLRFVIYEYLKQFTDDPGVQDTLTFLMSREVAHYQQFTAAINDLPVNFPPGRLAGDDRFQHVAFNMSDGDGDVRGRGTRVRVRGRKA